MITIASEDFVIDTILGKWHGAFPDEYKQDETHGGHRPKIRPVGKSIPFFNRAKYFPYPLDRQQNIRRFEVVDGPNLRILVPSKDIPGLNYQSTVWASLQAENTELVEKLRRQIDELKKDKAKLRKELRQLREEEEEKKKHESSGGAQKVDCPFCGAGQTPQKWSSNDGECQSCGQTVQKYKQTNSQSQANGGHS